MMRSLFLIHWNIDEALALAKPLQARGWHVDIEAEDGKRACARVLAKPPAAVVVFLTRLPSHGRETAAYLRSTPTGKHLPVFFVGGSEDARKKAGLKVPDASFSSPETLFEELASVGDVS
jgi:DNA-binding response OmpR family regulator